MANKINGNRDGKNGSNNTYSIPGRNSSITRKTIVKEVKEGKHPNHSIYKRNNTEYVRANPNPKKSDNVNKS